MGGRKPVRAWDEFPQPFPEARPQGQKSPRRGVERCSVAAAFRRSGAQAAALSEGAPFGAPPPSAWGRKPEPTIHAKDFAGSDDARPEKGADHDTRTSRGLGEGEAGTRAKRRDDVEWNFPQGGECDPGLAHLRRQGMPAQSPMLQRYARLHRQAKSRRSPRVHAGRNIARHEPVQENARAGNGETRSGCAAGNTDEAMPGRKAGKR